MNIEIKNCTLENIFRKRHVTILMMSPKFPDYIMSGNLLIVRVNK